MQDPKILDETLSLCRSVLEDLLTRAEKSEEPYTALRLETELFRALMTIGAFLLARLFGARTGYQGKSVPGHRDVGKGTHRLKYKGRKKRWVVTIFGRIFFWRAYYRNSKLKDSRWPRDEELGLVPRELLSPAVQEKVALLSAVTESYDQATQTLKEFLPVDLQYKQAQRECIKIGSHMERAEQEQIHKVFEERQMPGSPNVAPPEAVMIGTDGITVPHCAGEDMEIKVGRVDRVALQPPPAQPTRTRTLKPRRGAEKRKTESPSRKEHLADLKESREQREYKEASKVVGEALEEAAPGRDQRPMYRKTTETSSYVATARLGADQFGRMLWLAAQAIGVELAPLVLFLADGSKWCWDVCKTHFPNAIQILDVFHLAKHIIQTANVLFKPRSPEARAWRKRILVRILQGGIEEVIRELDTVTCLDETKRTACKDLHTYLCNNRSRMNYSEYIARGYPISSAIAEGACRHVIGTRMKGSGRRWDDDGADAMARLRALKCSGRWGSSFAERQQARLDAARELRRAA